MTQKSEVTFAPNVLRKLARLHARVEGAQRVAQAVSQAVQAAQMDLQVALTEACEDEGFALPQNGNTPLDINWRTGHLSLSATQEEPPP